MIGQISDGELGSSVRTKLNEVINKANEVDNKIENVGASDLRADLTGIVALSGNDVDWSTGAIFTKTLTANTTLTFSNVVVNKVITLKVDGDFALTLPSGCKILSGEYYGTGDNYIQIHSIGTSEFLTVFSQEV
jgi:hypothetical protein